MQPWYIFILLLFSLPSMAQETRYDTLRLFYPIDKTELETSQSARLDSLSLLLNRSKKVKISITGYADYLGTNPHNVDLSVARAYKVREYLASKGIDTSRVTHCDGKGALPAIALKNKHDRGVPLHRRVDVVVGWLVGKKPPTKPSATKLSQVDTKTIKQGDKIILDNLNFEGGRHILLPQSYPTLKKLVDILRKNPLLKIEVQGHICCDSTIIDGYDSDTRQYELSITRAKYIYDQLVNLGIDSTRLSFRGFSGKFRLIKDERTVEDQTANRRVEIKIISIGQEEQINPKTKTPKSK